MLANVTKAALPPPTTCSWREASVPGRTCSISRATCSSKARSTQTKQMPQPVQVQQCTCVVIERGGPVTGHQTLLCTTAGDGSLGCPSNVPTKSQPQVLPHLEHVLQRLPVELLALHHVANGLRQPARADAAGLRLISWLGSGTDR